MAVPRIFQKFSSLSVRPMFAVSQIQRLRGCSRRLHHSPEHSLTGMEWSYLAKHPDEEKPPLPYYVGAIIPARTWAAPVDDNIIYDHLWAEDQLAEELQNEHPMETCLRYTEATDAPAEGDHVELQVVDEIKVMDGKHSQIAKVNVLDHRPAHEKLRSPLPSGEAMTAKFYDPLYQDIEDDMPDIFGNTFHACHRETCVYRQLKPLWGTVVPRFYGSLKAQVPVPGHPRGRSRYVDAILYEYAPGIELSYIDADEWSQAERKTIMKAIIDGDSKIRQAGISQDDLVPRNVILHGRPGHPISVKIIDFDYAFFEFDLDPDAELEPEPPSDIVDRWTHKLSSPVDPFRMLIDWSWEEWIRGVYLR